MIVDSSDKACVNNNFKISFKVYTQHRVKNKLLYFLERDKFKQYYDLYDTIHSNKN